MSVGLSTTKADVDSRCSTVALSVFGSLKMVDQFKAWLDTVTVADLQGLGYTANEANLLKSAFTDLKKLSDVFNGAATQATTYDFRTFAKQLIGTGLY